MSIIKGEALDNVPRSIDETTAALEDEMEVKPQVKDEPVVEEIIWEFVEGARDLLSAWSGLQEVFRIPKKERVEQMKEHEREADKGDRQRSETDKDRVSTYDRLR